MDNQTSQFNIGVIIKYALIVAVVSVAFVLLSYANAYLYTFRVFITRISTLNMPMDTFSLGSSFSATVTSRVSHLEGIVYTFIANMAVLSEAFGHNLHLLICFAMDFLTKVKGIFVLLVSVVATRLGELRDAIRSVVSRVSVSEGARYVSPCERLTI